MYWKNVDERRVYNREYREDNKPYYNEKAKYRTEIYNALPNDYWWDNFDGIFEEFNCKCALTGTEDEITIDHFIPVIWGHGGTYNGNLLVLNIDINRSKGHHNPFEWIKKDINKERIDMQKWNELIHKLASLNKLSVDEFERFVYWCEENKRDVDEVKNSNEKTSLDLWKESLVRI